MPKLIERQGIFQVEYYDSAKGYTTRRSLGTQDRAVAERKFAEWQLANTDWPKATLEDTTVEEVVAQFFGRAQKYASHYVYRSLLEKVGKYLPGVSLANFKRSRQERFVEQLRAEGLAEGTIKRLMSGVKTAVKQAYEYEVIPSLPHIISVTDDTRRERVLSDEEARALLKAAGREEDFRYLAIALLTGARPAAILSLDKSQFDFENHLLRLLPKGERQVPKKLKPTTPLPTTLEELAQSWKSGPVFMVQPDHRLASVRSIWKRLGKAVDPEVTPYVLRHTVATELRRQSVPEWDIAGYMGHSAPGSRTTQRYAHYRPEYMREAAIAMDNYWRRINDSLDSGSSEVVSGTCGQGGGHPGSLEGASLPSGDRGWGTETRLRQHLPPLRV